jgi:hypothetical protein
MVPSWVLTFSAVIPLTLVSTALIFWVDVLSVVLIVGRLATSRGKIGWLCSKARDEAEAANMRPTNTWYCILDNFVMLRFLRKSHRDSLQRQERIERTNFPEQYWHLLLLFSEVSLKLHWMLTLLQRMSNDPLGGVRN